MPQKLILHCNLCPGDILTLTAAVEALHRSYPGEYLTDVRTSTPAIWEGNIWITVLVDDDPSVTHIQMEYPTVNKSDEHPVMFITGFTDYLSHYLSRPLPEKVNRPYVYLSENEKNWINQIQQHHTNGRLIPFWVVNSVVKNDYTAKQWPIEYYQEVIDKTQGLVQWVQIGSLEHSHQKLSGAISLLGKTDHRSLMRLIYHCHGGLGPVTYLQHLCAAFEKPYICLVGGREGATWVSYPYQQTLHTIGHLPCCRTGGCWKSRVVPLGDGDKKDSELCTLPILGMKAPIGKCMALIRPEEVIAILKRIIHCKSMQC